MIFDHVYFVDLDNVAIDVFLARNRKFLDRLIFTPHIHHALFQFFCLFAHLLGQLAHLAALVREEIRLLLAINDLLLQLGILLALALDPVLDFLYHRIIVANVALHLLGVDIQVKNAFGKAVKKIGIVRDNDHGLVIHDQEFDQVIDTGLIQIIGRLVQEQDVWFLDQRLGQEDTCLLPARQIANATIGGDIQINDLQDFGNLTLDVTWHDLEWRSEICLDAHIGIFTTHDLIGTGNACSVGNADLALLGLELALDKPEERRFARTILPHQGQLGTGTHAKTRFL